MVQVTGILMGIVEGVVGCSIEISTPMMAAGLDSLAAVELRNMVQQRFAVSLSATAAFDYPTIQVTTCMDALPRVCQCFLDHPSE